MNKIVSVFIFLISLLVISSSAAMAASISYSLTDLSSQQENLWQIDYQVSDLDSDVYDNFLIYFEYGEFESLTLVSSSPDWDAYVSEPQFFLEQEEDGFLDALWEGNTGEVLSASFSVQVIYLGDDMPGAQSFELYSSSDWEVFTAGTTSPVPVPGALVIMLSGLAGLAGCRRKFGNNKS